MRPQSVSLDLASLRLGPGEGRRLELCVPVEELSFGGQSYVPEPGAVPVVLDVSRLGGGGWALRLSFVAAVSGACMRCLKEARPTVAVEAREVQTSEPDAELSSPYVDHDVLDVAAWTRDALVLELPPRILCREDCAGLCPVCAADLNEVRGEHVHESSPDPRWEKLRELLR